jgi:hypothetical protein
VPACYSLALHAGPERFAPWARGALELFYVVLRAVSQIRERYGVALLIAGSADYLLYRDLYLQALLAC